MPGHFNPLRPAGKPQNPATLALLETVYRFPEAVETPGWDRIQKALAHAAAIRQRIARDHPSSDPGPSKFVTGPLPTGDDPLATPAPRRQIPEPDAVVAGRRGAGVSQHQLHVVEPGGQLIDATGRFEARRRNPFNNGSAA